MLIMTNWGSGSAGQRIFNSLSPGGWREMAGVRGKMAEVQLKATRYIQAAQAWREKR
jgi:hypothetical protein